MSLTASAPWPPRLPPCCCPCSLSQGRWPGQRQRPCTPPPILQPMLSQNLAKGACSLASLPGMLGSPTSPATARGAQGFRRCTTSYRTAPRAEAQPRTFGPRLAQSREDNVQCNRSTNIVNIVLESSPRQRAGPAVAHSRAAHGAAHGAALTALHRTCCRRQSSAAVPCCTSCTC